MTRTATQELIAKRYWVIGTMLIAVLFSAFYFWRYPPAYASTVSFFVGGTKNMENKTGEVPRGHSADIVNLYHMARSTAMFEHLAKEFDLMAHYGLDPADPLVGDKLHMALDALVDVRMTEYDGMEITVKDRDRAMAARMANTLFGKLCRMNEEVTVHELERTIVTYDRVIQSTAKRVNDRSAELLELAQRIRSADRPLTKAERDAGRSVGLDHELLLMAAKMDAANDDLVRSKQQHEMLAALIGSREFTDVRLKQRAIEDLETDLVGKAVLNIALIACAAGVLAMVIILLVYGEQHARAEAYEESTPRMEPRVVAMGSGTR